MDAEPYYFFEYDRPGKKKPGKTTWRMTIAYAAERYPGYRPMLETAEVRGDQKWESFVPFEPGSGPVHWFKDEKSKKKTAE